MNLTKRQLDILIAIIEQYAEVAVPVGSVTLAKLFDVSSATIRLEMARLEELGLIQNLTLRRGGFRPTVAIGCMSII